MTTLLLKKQFCILTAPTFKSLTTLNDALNEIELIGFRLCNV